MEKIAWPLLSKASQLFGRELFEAEPNLEASAGMMQASDSEEFDLVVRVVSPTEDPDRTIYIWMDGGDEPSIEFGSWHTHSSLEQDDSRSIIRIVRSIQKDQLVILHDPMGTSFGKNRVIDLSDKNSVVEALTGNFVSEVGELKSWTGLRDRDVSISETGLD